MPRGAHRRRYLIENPYCCFCGGGVKATTIEHAPPRVFFKDKKRPAGLEFPACERCNHGSSQLDQVASYFSLVSGLVEDNVEYTSKLLKGISNNTPKVLQLLSHKSNEVINVRGEKRPMVVASLSPKLARLWINPWIAKQAFALWYFHAGYPIDKHGLVSVRWITNHAIMEKGLPDGLFEIAQLEGRLAHGKKQVSEQFFYRYQVSADLGVGIFVIGGHDGSVFFAAVYSKKHHELSAIQALKHGDVFRTNKGRGIHAVPPHALDRIKGKRQRASVN